MKTVGDYREEDLVQLLTRDLPAGRGVKVGIGDDSAAVLPCRAGWLRLLKTDCVIEGIHFRREDDPVKVGWKAMARATSDIAAMGGLPRYALVTLAVPVTEEVRYLKRLYRGISSLAAEFDIGVIGGELSRSPGPRFIAVDMTGEVERAGCVTRTGGKPGDRLFVTGRLGGSLGGRHLSFVPRVREARWLTASFRIRAMIDLSDGLGSDLPRLADASGTGWVIDYGQLPLHRGCTIEDAVCDGEDYELLFAIGRTEVGKLKRAWSRRFPKIPLTCIGHLTKEKPRDGIPPLGFEHFRKTR